MTTALYRRYRPETFADVIGQEHVTEPLMAAIAGGRTSHAYLFSGPRGCGKTTSARILARCLNCERGPTPVPCGTCDSCVELARGGSGSLDVVEIDAASHNGVDDARELRERAAFAPARDRYKIFILDEAHMVTLQGFNALLKLVEEPPPHVKFVFATTEPEKVISTIRSRTHHYPFRLVPPDRLQAYLESICQAEGVAIGSGVLPLVVRAGGGSVRDSLSVLDQLIAGAEDGVDYTYAVALLGYTPATLLDDAVEALEAHDGSSVFRVIDRVIESGHDPRRFVEDLLQRLRDLIVIVAAGEKAADALRGVPEDQFRRMISQAERLGLAQLSRAADLALAALTEMTGATSPRLQLELLCARLLLPAADEGVHGYGARLERLERRLDGRGDPGPASSGSASAPVPSSAPAPAPAPARSPVSAAAPRTAPADTEPAPELHEAPPSGPAAPAPARREARTPAASSGREEGRAAPQEGTPREAGRAGPGLDTETVRRRWLEVLETLSRIRRASWIITSQNAQVVDLSNDVLRLRFDTPGIASTFRNGQHAQALERALRETLGLIIRIEAVTDEGGPPLGGGGRGTGLGSRSAPGAAGGVERRGSRGAPPSSDEAGHQREGQSGDSSSAVADAAADWGTDRPDAPDPAAPARLAASQQSRSQRQAGQESPRTPASGVAMAGRAREMASAPAPEPSRLEPRPSDEPPPLEAPPLDEPPFEDPGPGAAPRTRPSQAAREARPPVREATPTAGPASPSVRPTPTDGWPPGIDENDVEGEPLDAAPLVGAPLVERVLGATLIDEIPVDPADSPPRDAT